VRVGVIEGATEGATEGAIEAVVPVVLGVGDWVGGDVTEMALEVLSVFDDAPAVVLSAQEAPPHPGWHEQYSNAVKGGTGVVIVQFPWPEQPSTHPTELQSSPW